MGDAVEDLAFGTGDKRRRPNEAEDRTIATAASKQDKKKKKEKNNKEKTSKKKKHKKKSKGDDDDDDDDENDDDDVHDSLSVKKSDKTKKKKKETKKKSKSSSKHASERRRRRPRQEEGNDDEDRSRGRSESRSSSRSSSGSSSTSSDYDDDDWVEKAVVADAFAASVGGAGGASASAGADAGTAAAFALSSTGAGASSIAAAEASSARAAAASSAASSNTAGDRQGWMAEPLLDLFGSRSVRSLRDVQQTEREKEQARKDTIRSERELNPYFASGGTGLPGDSTASSAAADSGAGGGGDSSTSTGSCAQKRKYEYGDAGSSWRMIKLRRIYDTAEEEGRNVQDVALERYGSLEEFEDAERERRFLDGRGAARGSGGGGGSRRRDDEGARHERSTRQHEFRRPANVGGAAAADDVDAFGRIRRDTAGHRGGGSDRDGPRSAVSAVSASDISGRSHGPPRDSPSQGRKPLIPTASIPATGPSAVDGGDFSDEPPMTSEEMNKLQAKILKAQMLGRPEEKELMAQLEHAKARSSRQAATKELSVVVPTIDSRGRLQDTGSVVRDQPLPGNRRGFKKLAADTHDAQGNRVRLLDDSEKTVQDLVLEERMGHAHNYDMDVATRIAADATFKEGLDYMDENADRFARQSASSDYKKSRHAINDYKRATAAQEKCAFCWHDDAPPRTKVIALGTKSYLGLPGVVPMADDHCLIVPVQHVLTTLECDDDVWDEINNFMKCLIQMQWERGGGMIFMEQVVNFRWHRHTVIECVPVPSDKFEDAPAYFKEALNAAGDEWSQHRKVIDTAKHGFRGSMVKNLPYFHVWFEPKRGLGHVIENSESWEEWFGREVVASSMLELPPDRWRRPRRLSPGELATRASQFKERFAKWNWTKQLE
ncbi:CwfJ C-terminus 1-domain-containing protein-like protein [Zopfochytrium polystomum]|nr:CwfJ C-terminus 1-domain-containing protein-like protein [Zopfochytrium polystomum]